MVVPCFIVGVVETTRTPSPQKPSLVKCIGEGRSEELAPRQDVMALPTILNHMFGCLTVKVGLGQNHRRKVNQPGRNLKLYLAALVGW